MQRVGGWSEIYKRDKLVEGQQTTARRWFSFSLIRNVMFTVKCCAGLNLLNKVHKDAKLNTNGIGSKCIVQR